MSLNYVTLILDLYDGDGNPASQGWARLTPSAQLTDTTNNQLVTQAPVVAYFRLGLTPQVTLLATDNGTLAPAGWGWTISFVNVPGNPASFSFFLPYANGATQYLSSQAPVGTALAMQGYVPLAGGTMTGPLILSGNPAAALQAAPKQYVDSAVLGAVIRLLPSGDMTGVTDAAYLNAAVMQLGAQGGTVCLAPGVFYWACGSVVISRAGVTIQGAGRWSTVVYAVGTGDCLRMYSAQPYTSGWGGGGKGFTIDGTNAGAGSCGLHAGDIYQLQWDVGVRNFKGTGSKNVWFDNQYYWAEDMYGHLFVEQGTSNLIFDNSANLSGQATGSFARSNLVVVMDAKGVGNGVIIRNGAQVYAGDFSLQGNMDYSTTGTQYYALTVQAPPAYSFTATNASPCVFTAAGMYYGNGTNVFLQGGSVPAGFTAGTAYWVVNANIPAGTFQLAATAGGAAIASTSTGSGTVLTFQPSTLHHARVNINIECNNQSGIQPGTINFTSAAAATGYNSVSGCTGIIDFGADNPFASASNPYGNFYFDGPVYGDAVLWRSMGLGAASYFNGALASNSGIFASGVAVSVVNTTAAITGMKLGGGSGDSQFLTVINNGTGSITFAAAGTSLVANGTSCVIQPNTAQTFQWIAGAFKWYPS